MINLEYIIKCAKIEFDNNEANKYDNKSRVLARRKFVSYRLMDYIKRKYKRYENDCNVGRYR